MVIWDSSCKGESISLSQDQLTFTAPQSEQNRGKHFLRATKGVSSGKWYWELTVTKQSSLGVGFTTSEVANGINLIGKTGQAITIRLFAGFPVYSYGYVIQFFDIENKISVNGSCLVSGAEQYPGLGTYGFALDLDNKEFYLYKDGKKVLFIKNSYLARDNLKLYPALVIDSYYGGGYATANFGATPFVYTVPEEYLSYDANIKYLFKDDEGYKRYKIEKGAPITYADGTLTASTSTPGMYKAPNFSGVSSGKWYWEQTITSDMRTCVGFTSLNTPGCSIVLHYITLVTNNPDSVLDDRLGTGDRFVCLSSAEYSPPHVVGFALDLDNGTIEFYRTHNSTPYVTSGKIRFRIKDLIPLTPTVSSYASYASCGATANFGATPFKFPIPEDFLPLNDSRNVTSIELVSTSFPTEQEFKEKGMDIKKDIMNYPVVCYTDALDHAENYTYTNKSIFIYYDSITLNEESLDRILQKDCYLVFSDDLGTTFKTISKSGELTSFDIDHYEDLPKITSIDYITDEMKLLLLNHKICLGVLLDNQKLQAKIKPVHYYAFSHSNILLKEETVKVNKNKIYLNDLLLQETSDCHAALTVSSIRDGENILQIKRGDKEISFDLEKESMYRTKTLRDFRLYDSGYEEKNINLGGKVAVMVV